MPIFNNISYVDFDETQPFLALWLLACTQHFFQLPDRPNDPAVHRIDPANIHPRSGLYKHPRPPCTLDGQACRTILCALTIQEPQEMVLT